MRRALPTACGCLALLIAISPFVPLDASADDPKLDLPAVQPLSPRDELATFRIEKGFKVELVACEPAVIDPVGIAFDEDGRLFAVEMISYPGDGTAEVRTS